MSSPIEKIKCFLGFHNIDEKYIITKKKEGSIFILDDKFKGNGELIRTVETTESNCKTCGENIKLKIITTDTPIGV